MAFIDDAKRIVEDVSKKVVEGSGKAYETAKMKYSKFDIQNDIRRLYEELGRVVFNAHISDDDISEDAEILFEKITDKKAELAEIEEKLNIIKNNVICKTCGADCKSGTHYCPNCGSEIL